MPPRSRPRLVAIGIDAAVPSLVQVLADRGDMPTLRKLFAEGVSGPVVSPAHIGSGAVWPTFLTATSPWEHGKFSFWSWDPDRMRLDRETIESLQPFWRAPELAHRTVGVLDVPFAPPPAPMQGFEITGWGAHDFVLAGMQVCPPSLAPRVRAVAGKHPFTNLVDASASARVPADLLDQCLDGVERRGRLIEHLLREESPELFITVFSETHRASHLFWHTAPRVGNRPGPPPPPDGPGLVDVFREVDRQIGRVLMLAGDEAAILVFSP